VGQRQTQEPSSKLKEVVTAAKPRLTNGELQELKELLTEYEDIFAGDDEDYGRTKKSVPLYRYGRRPTNSPVPEEHTPGKTSGSKRNA
jgi:hypothetical protein